MAKLQDLKTAAIPLLSDAATQSHLVDLLRLAADASPGTIYDALLQAEAELPAKIEAARKANADALAGRDAAAAVLAKEGVSHLERLARYLAKFTILAAEVGDLEAAMTDEAQRSEAVRQSALRQVQADQQAAIERCNAHRTTVQAFASVDNHIRDLAGAVRKAWDTALSAGPTMSDKEFDRMVDRAFGVLRHVVLHHLGFLPGMGQTIPADQAIFADYAPDKPLVTPAEGWDGSKFKPGGEYAEYAADLKPAT
ncbi:hypothetical protein [Dongia rigui]|uniref:Uncharacterized protein n=1 Tax=Dongia rigui TaxID=940149 RepID=A0ABU5E0V6_9PROT|nr:hypothetical protein [Dongia rigui]MDY0872825.1 hypothetical protein [Dongia rigui]